MFTGIVQDLVTVQAIAHEQDISRLTLDLGGLTRGLELGASVAVNGVCLTVTAVNQASACFDVIVETLNHTNLGQLEAGDLVNVERSFSVGEEIGGHIVSGHVSGTAEILARRVDGHNHVVVFSSSDVWSKYIFHKGFVAIDGASLTVSAVRAGEGEFEVSLIPETLQRTTLGRYDEGDYVNVEVDAQTVTTVDTIERLMSDAQWRQQMGLSA